MLGLSDLDFSGQTRKREIMDNALIEEIFEADSAGWTVTEISDDLGITRQQVIDLFLSYERYDPSDSELNR